MSKGTYRQRLQVKTKPQLQALADRIKFPYRKAGCKDEIIISLASYFDSFRVWNAIING